MLPWMQSLTNTMTGASGRVWYLQAGHLTDGKFVCESQGSAVLVLVKSRDSGSQPVRLLTTVQHVLRSRVDERSGDYTGPYWTHFRAWPPGAKYVSKRAWELTVHQPLTPDENRPFSNAGDIAFLEFASPPQAFPAADPMDDGDCHPGLDDLGISAYDSGEALLDFGDDVVTAMPHDSWNFTGINASLNSGILSPGEGNPMPGASGGGVFHKGRLAGIYRGVFDPTGQHIFFTLPSLREWCAERNYLLLPGRRAGRTASARWAIVAAVTAALAVAAFFMIRKPPPPPPSEYVLRGQVVAADSMRPVADVKVQLTINNATKKSTLTDRDGRFEIFTSDPDSTDGANTLTFSHAKYVTNKPSAQAVRIDRKLNPQIYQLKPKPPP